MLTVSFLSRADTNLRELTLVQIHADSVHLLDGAVEVRLEIAVRTQSFLDVTRATVLGMKLHRLEVGDILTVEEHVPDSRSLLVHLVRVAGENDALGNDACRIRGHERAGGNKVRYR